MIPDLEYGDLEAISISKGSSENTLIFRNDYGSGVLRSMYDLESHVSSGGVISSGDDGKPGRLKL